jgi:rod shape-determining protein MreD
MSIEFLKRFGLFVLLVLFQGLVLNHVHLMGVALPLLYLYFPLTIRRNTPKWAVLLWSFFLGLAVDMFSSTPGMAAASLTLTGFLQPYLLELFLPREAPENMKSALSTLGFTKFLTLASILVFVQCLLFFTIESFSFFNWLQWLLNVIGSTVLTLILLMALESVRK